jgi:FMN phosphatase YigB (HAD superfamily)
MTSRSLDAVTFDLWNTLIAHDETYDDRIRAARIGGILDVLRQSDIDKTYEDVEAAYSGSDLVLAARWATDRDMDTAEQVEAMLRCLGLTPAPGLISAVSVPYADAVIHVEPFLVDGAKEALEEVRESGLRMALISNTGRTPGQAMRRVMRKLDILDYFPVTTFSNEVGYLKPSPVIFEKTLSQIGARPGRTVHVGDHDVLDVLGARNYGMKSVRVLRYAGSREAACPPDACIETLAELAGAIRRLEG